MRASPVTLQSSHLTACPWPAHRRQMHTRGQICRRDPFCARHRLARIEGYAAFDRLPERWGPSREPSHSTLTKMPFTQREDLGHSSIDLTGPYVCPRLTRVSEGDWPVPNHLLSRFRRPPDPLVRWRTRFGQVLAATHLSGLGVCRWRTSGGFSKSRIWELGCRVLNAAVTRDRRALGGRPEEQ